MEEKGRVRQHSESSDPQDMKRPKPDEQSPGVSASPPKFVNFDKLMESLYKDTQSMALAHEIAVNEEFKLEKKPPAENSLYALVQQNMLKAYWDIIKEDISKDPPVFDMVLKLCSDIRQLLMDLLLPHQQQMREHIADIFDLEHIKRRCEHEKSIDPLRDYSPALLNLMQRLCCPMRDDEINRLKGVQDTIELFQGILRVLEEMKLDFANFLIQQIRPVVKSTIVNYEKEKSDRIESAQRLLGNLDPLKKTRKWLEYAYEELHDRNEQKPALASVLSHAYLDIVFREDYINEMTDLPETLVVDAERIHKLQQAFLICNVSAAILTIAQGYCPATGDLKRQIKDTCIIILKEIQCNVESELREALSDLSTKLFQDLQKIREGKLTTAQEAMFRSQLLDLADFENAVREVLSRRIIAFVTEIAKGGQNVKVPPGLSALETELTKLAADFLQIISLNRATHADKYTSIVTDIQDMKRVP